MNLIEMITIGMGHILSEYAKQNGVYDSEITIEQERKWLDVMKDLAKLMEEITEQNKQKVEKIELPMPYVLTMLDAMQAIKKHKLYDLMGGGKDDEEHIDIVIEEFLEPLAMSTDDVEIVFYD